MFCFGWFWVCSICLDFGILDDVFVWWWLTEWVFLPFYVCLIFGVGVGVAGVFDLGGGWWGLFDVLGCVSYMPQFSIITLVGLGCWLGCVFWGL